MATRHTKNYLLVAALFLATQASAVTPRAPEKVWKMFLSGNSSSIPSSYWQNDGKKNSLMGYDDSYFLTQAPKQLKDNLPDYSKNLYTTRAGYPSFMENSSLGRQCVAFSKAATGDFNLTSAWTNRGGKVIPHHHYDISVYHAGKMVAFFQGLEKYPTGQGGKVGHTGIFLKYQIDNGRISGFWIADTNWRGNEKPWTEGKLRKHFIPVNNIPEYEFNGRFNAKNYYFVDVVALKPKP